MRFRHVQRMVTTSMVCGVSVLAPVRCGASFIAGLQERRLAGLFIGLLVAFVALLWAAFLGRREWPGRGRRSPKATTTQELPLQVADSLVCRSCDPGDAHERCEGGFAALPAGTLLGHKYVVRKVRAVGEHHNVYLAEGLTVSRRCAVCSAVATDPDEHFCSACGADLASAVPMAARYLVSEVDDDRAASCERQLLGMQLAHPGLQLPEAVFEEVHHGVSRTYRVMPESSLSLLQSRPRPVEVSTIVSWGADLAESMAFLHKHQVTLGVVDEGHIAVEGRRARWTGLSDATVIPPEERTGAHEAFTRDVQGLGHVLAGLLAADDPDWRASLPASLNQLLSLVLDRPAEVGAATLASGLRLILNGGQVSQLGSVWVGYRSDVGLTRQLNEDSYLVLDLAPVLPADGPAAVDSGLYVVADGMGGYDAGEVASGLAVQVMAQLSREDPGQTPIPGSAPIVPRARLKHWVEVANRTVFEARRSVHSEMGTTLVAALMVGTTATIANVGDSRCYHMGAGGIRRVTTDHSLVERLVTIGQITRAEAESHPQRNVVYRAIGDKPEVEVDLFEQPLLRGEALLLCSDGLSGMVSEERLLQLWNTSVSPQEACDRMVASANRAGGEDNITVIIVQARQDGVRQSS